MAQRLHRPLENGVTLDQVALRRLLVGRQSLELFQPLELDLLGGHVLDELPGSRQFIRVLPQVAGEHPVFAGRHGRGPEAGGTDLGDGGNAQLVAQGFGVAAQRPVPVDDHGRLPFLEHGIGGVVVGLRRNNLVFELQVMNELQGLHHGITVQGRHVGGVIEGPTAEAAQPGREPEGFILVVDEAPGVTMLELLRHLDQLVGVLGRSLHHVLVVEQHQVIAVVVRHPPKGSLYFRRAKCPGEKLVQKALVVDFGDRQDDFELAERACEVVGDAYQVGSFPGQSRSLELIPQFLVAVVGSFDGDLGMSLLEVGDELVHEGLHIVRLLIPHGQFHRLRRLSCRSLGGRRGLSRCRGLSGRRRFGGCRHRSRRWSGLLTAG